MLRFSNFLGRSKSQFEEHQPKFASSVSPKLDNDYEVDHSFISKDGIVTDL